METVGRLQKELDKVIKEPRVEQISVEVYTYAGDSSYVFRFESIQSSKEQFRLDSVSDIHTMENVPNDLEDEMFSKEDVIEFAFGDGVYNTELWTSALYGSGLFSLVE